MRYAFVEDRVEVRVGIRLVAVIGLQPIKTRAE